MRGAIDSGEGYRHAGQAGIETTVEAKMNPMIKLTIIAALTVLPAYAQAQQASQWSQPLNKSLRQVIADGYRLVAVTHPQPGATHFYLQKDGVAGRLARCTEIIFSEKVLASCSELVQ